jgi:hypothetical protein
MSMVTDNRSIPELFSDAISQLSKLVSNEVQLARAELAQKASEAAMGAGFLVAGAVIMIPTLVMLLFAFAFWLTEMGMSPPVAYLIAAAVGAAVSGGLIVVGMRRLKPENLTPQVTIEQVERDMATAKELVK